MFRKAKRINVRTILKHILNKFGGTIWAKFTCSHILESPLLNIAVPQKIMNILLCCAINLSGLILLSAVGRYSEFWGIEIQRKSRSPLFWSKRIINIYYVPLPQWMWRKWGASYCRHKVSSLIKFRASLKAPSLLTWNWPGSVSHWENYMYSLLVKNKIELWMKIIKYNNKSTGYEPWWNTGTHKICTWMIS